MKRVYLTLLCALATAAQADEDVRSTAPQATASAQASPQDPESIENNLRVPESHDRFDWEWQGDWDESGDLIVGSGLSYATSRRLAIGGRYAMSVQPDVLGDRDADPARYTLYMRLRF